MKKILTIIALAGYLTISFIASAQTSVMASRVDYSSTEIGENAIIRNDEGDGTLIYYEDLNGLNYFLYRTTDTSTYAFKYSWSLYNYRFSVHDMVMLKNHCFFCGAFIDIYDPVNTPMGAVGYVDMDHISDGTTPRIDIYICTILNTKVFTQMDGTLKNGGRELLCLVGESKRAATPSCAAFVECISNSLGVSWQYHTLGIKNTDETLTDIAFSGDGKKVVAVSKFAGDPNKFGLRGEYTSNLYVFTTPPSNLTYFPNFTNRNIIDTYGLTLASSSSLNPTLHNDSIVARIVCPPNTEDFTVAYECVDNTLVCETRRQVAMFQIDVSSFTMNVTGQQIVRGYFEEGFTFTDMLYIPDNKTFALLHHSKNSSRETAAAVQFPTWLFFGQINTLISDVALHSSLDLQYQNGKPYLNMAGDRDGDNRICHFWQNLNYMESSCYLTRPLSLSEILLGSSTLTLSYGEAVDIDWNPFRLFNSPIYATPSGWNNDCYSNHVE